MLFRSNDLTVISRARLLSLLTAVCVISSICTSCSTTADPAGDDTSQTTLSEHSSVVSTTDSTTAVSITVSSTRSSDTSSPQITEVSESAESPTTEQSEPVAVTEEQTAESSAAQSSTVQTTTTTATTTTATTTASTSSPSKPPAEIIIPDVKTLSAPQSKAEINDSAMIDYSNASCGYIAASYSGSSARAKLRIVGNGITNDHDLSTGGVVEYFPLPQGSGDYTITIYEQLEGKSYLSALECKATLTIADEVDMYLYPNRYVMFNKGSTSVYKAAELCAGVNGTVEKLASIFGYITDNVTYDYDLAATVTSGYIPDPDSVLKKRTGICFDYASLFAAMARSQGIPTRLVIGYASPDIYHAWNEVYTEETGWITPELLLSQKGFNLVDSTFYASAANKAAVAEYISSGSNYSAIYRY